MELVTEIIITYLKLVFLLMRALINRTRGPLDDIRGKLVHVCGDVGSIVRRFTSSRLDDPDLEAFLDGHELLTNQSRKMAQENHLNIDFLDHFQHLRPKLSVYSRLGEKLEISVPNERQVVRKSRSRSYDRDEKRSRRDRR